MLFPWTDALSALASPPPAQVAGGTFDYGFETVDGLKLAGKLSLPPGRRGPVPVVVFIGGSGPWNVDYQARVPGPGGQGTRLFTILPIDDLARRCEAEGLAFIRYAKRGVDPDGAQNAAWKTARLDRLMADADALLARVKADPRLDGSRIALVGHSEGTAIATWIGGHDPSVKGFGMLGLMRRNLEAVLADQLVGAKVGHVMARFDAPAPDGFLSAQEIQAAEAQGARFPDWRKADTDRDGRLSRAELAAYLGGPFQGWLARVRAAGPEEILTRAGDVSDMPAGWWNEHFAHETVGEAWRTITTPVLVQQGTADAQTAYATEALPFEEQLSAQAHPDHRLIGYEGLSHEFTDAGGCDHSGEVFATLAAWLGAHLKP